ncbi:Uma2 family endonuclease [Emticicia agri]|uniref:Uma2 family endonuclease n=1 Tax=Emticicia agri TaxID=2492393 RepID=A0A4Q5M449_9BACT|nr:Uma2 family endonuclease [Emticicia agri]RYU96879.1 Uma2 family endonuclease [Emticicia agri]
METTLLTPKKRERKIPEYLVKEVLNGTPIYYKGYKSVLNGNKTLEEIMGSSGLQGLIILFIQKLLIKNLDEKLYLPLTGEVGLHLSHKNNLSGDIMVYKTGQIPVFTKKYLEVAPMLQVEVDTNIDNSNITDNQYVTQKTKRLLEFGVEKLIWVFTTTQTIWIAEPHQDWRIVDWNKTIDLIEGIQMNLGEYLSTMNVELD